MRHAVRALRYFLSPYFSADSNLDALEAPAPAPSTPPQAPEGLEGVVRQITTVHAQLEQIAASIEVARLTVEKLVDIVQEDHERLVVVEAAIVRLDGRSNGTVAPSM